MLCSLHVMWGQRTRPRNNEREEYHAFLLSSDMGPLFTTPPPPPHQHGWRVQTKGICSVERIKSKREGTCETLSLWWQLSGGEREGRNPIKTTAKRVALFQHCTSCKDKAQMIYPCSTAKVFFCPSHYINWKYCIQFCEWCKPVFADNKVILQYMYNYPGSLVSV